MTVASTINARYSVRQFDPNKKISEKDISLILHAVVMAPSAQNRQPYHIYRLRSSEAKDKMQMCYDRDWLRGASDILLVVGKDHEAWTYTDGMNTSVYVDAAIAVSYMQLQAWELGVGSVWVCAFDREKASQLFDLQGKNETPIALLVLGYEAEGYVRRERNYRDISELMTTL